MNKNKRKRLHKKYRRRMKARTRIRHKLVGGRTGSKRQKQRASMLHELKKIKKSVEKLVTGINLSDEPAKAERN